MSIGDVWRIYAVHNTSTFTLMQNGRRLLKLEKRGSYFFRAIVYVYIVPPAGTEAELMMRAMVSACHSAMELRLTRN